MIINDLDEIKHLVRIWWRDEPAFDMHEMRVRFRGGATGLYDKGPWYSIKVDWQIFVKYIYHKPNFYLRDAKGNHSLFYLISQKQIWKFSLSG